MKREDIEKILTNAGVDEQKLKLFTISGTSFSFLKMVISYAGTYKSSTAFFYTV